MQQVELGGNIVLSGFQDMDGGTMIILKKIIGNYARKFSDATQNFEKLIVSLNPQNSEYFVDVQLMHDGSSITSQFSDKNIFFAIDNVMKKIETAVGC
ncbi:MAG TPA: hypothetical protein VI894_02030 [Candidatus Nanoarchaeia archaeon]|nr:hypothetical protein [Candidatus Nanoarchaeia archaeon]